MRASVIMTVKNEEGTIDDMLSSLLSQTRQPEEIVIVDGGSTDRTVERVNSFIAEGAPIKLLVVPGCNISQGRNRAVEAASGEIIVSTDAGVRLAPDWLAKLLAPFESSNATILGEADSGPIDVVSGFFKPDPRSIFEIAMGAAVLPAVEDIDPTSFLPSSRSVAYTRAAWVKVGGYPEWLDYCEDVVFDLNLRRLGCRFHFVPDAVALFRPRSTLKDFFRQYYLYARGDGKAGLWFHRHLIRYAAYTIGCLVLLLGFWYKGWWLMLFLGAAGYLYRPYRRLYPLVLHCSGGDRIKAVLLVPLIRLTGDIAKMIGYPVGVLWRLKNRGLRA
ncbi:MAG: glycosyltransferase [Chloroflexi bacterium]|nr:glycosyltransferase [Chloroflexota bacterium]MCL5075336.1 glycosyltransferase [Chloroflexota bacterium]